LLSRIALRGRLKYPEGASTWRARLPERAQGRQT
jgi:hypothetical protein